MEYRFEFYSIQTKELFFLEAWSETKRNKKPKIVDLCRNAVPIFPSYKDAVTENRIKYAAIKVVRYENVLLIID
jgi:hypothetical protein